MTKAALTLNPALDVPALAARFASSGRIQVPDFVTSDSAASLAGELAASHQWRRVINGGDKVFEIAAGDFAALPGETRRSLDEAVIRGAGTGFQFRYDAIRVPEEATQRAGIPPRLAEFAALMNAPATLSLLADITGATDVGFADAQATRYGPGDFLTRHDDDVAGKHRRFAYVLGLSPHWRPEWGGLTLFVGGDGGVVEAIAPRCGALSLFAVPQPHSVSIVAPYAAAARISITGWLRAR